MLPVGEGLAPAPVDAAALAGRLTTVASGAGGNAAAQGAGPGGTVGVSALPALVRALLTAGPFPPPREGRPRQSPLRQRGPAAPAR